jgi:hypothetical protein
VSKGKQKLAVNLTDDAARVVRQLADEEGITVSEVIRRGIALEKFVLDQLHSGAEVLLSRDGGKTVERVHFVIG